MIAFAACWRRRRRDHERTHDLGVVGVGSLTAFGFKSTPAYRRSYRTRRTQRPGILLTPIAACLENAGEEFAMNLASVGQ
jgi:hypothetical protein